MWIAGEWAGGQGSAIGAHGLRWQTTGMHSGAHGARRDQVACSAETLSELGDDVDYVDLGAIHVKGRAEPVACYQINRIGALANPNAAPAMKIALSTAVVAGSH